MKRHEPFWLRVNELLDGRADPLADPGIQEHLGEFPEDLAKLERLGARLEVLELQPRPEIARAARIERGGLPWPVLCGAAAGLSLALWSPALDGPRRPENDPPATVRAAAVPAIHDFRVDWVVDDGTTHTHRTLTPSGETVFLERFHEPDASSPIARVLYREEIR